jgi:hypothetical protein
VNRAEWVALGQKRLVNILRKRIVATDRTLEQKISDSGPNHQRVEPVILTQARRQMILAGRILTLKRGRTPWYYLAETTADEVAAWMEVVEPIYLQTQDATFKQRVGQAMEIAVCRALMKGERPFLGSFADLDDHDDRRHYKKTDPAMVISGSKIEKGPLDNILFAPKGMAGIEIKNYRTWLYPDSAEVRELLWKCSDIGAVPVLMARRVPFITFRLLNLSGCLVYQNFNQIYANADKDLASLVRDKDLLGYHDVRVGNEPDDRMLKFIVDLLPDLTSTALPTYQKFRETHLAYGRNEIGYAEWVRTILEGSGVWTTHEASEMEGGEAEWSDEDGGGSAGI